MIYDDSSPKKIQIGMRLNKGLGVCMAKQYVYTPGCPSHVVETTHTAPLSSSHSSSIVNLPSFMPMNLLE